MFMKIRYHPLVDGDTEGAEKYPLFSTEDEMSAKTGYRYYLEEMIPRVYTLCQGRKLTNRKEENFSVCCPRCGKAMDRISFGKETRQRPMYMCRACSKERKV